METLLSIPIIVSLLSLAFVAYLVFWIKKNGMGSKEMQDIYEAIKEGSNAFLKRQYKTIAIILAILSFALFELYTLTKGREAGVHIVVSFLLGAILSAISGLVGMWISTRSNIRSAAAAQTSFGRALEVAFRAGAVSGVTITALSLLGISGLVAFYTSLGYSYDMIPGMIAGFGFGASLVALFAQLGGGIYTKAADVGADLVGKIEKGIPEDDPRNPAVIADLVGDNVGDCAGRGADLFESTAAENIAAMILGASLVKTNPGLGLGVIFFPLVLRAFGLICAIIGIMFVKAQENDKPLDAMNKGYYITSILATIVFYFATMKMLGNINFFYAGLVGILASLAFVFITQYYTSSDFRPIKQIIEGSKTGHATNIISGLAIGFESTGLTVITIGASLLLSYYFGEKSGLIGGGLYGTAVATMGMLASAAYILAMDTFGPITDNAGGIVEMANLPEEVRVRTDKLDTAGNTTKALTKGYAMGSAALASFLLFSAYLEEAGLMAGGIPVVNLADIKVFVASLIGGMLVFYFSASALSSVGRAAGSIVEEVRRQFKENPKLMSGEVKPDYAKCVDITTSAALKQMIFPGVLVVATTILVGMFLKAEAEAGYIMVGTIVGILLATVMNNAGGAWDNAKKYIEQGHEGGKGGYVHASAVTGDTVGDPFKDTAGPSLHVLVKLLGTLSLALLPLFL